MQEKISILANPTPDHLDALLRDFERGTPYKPKAISVTYALIQPQDETNAVDPNYEALSGVTGVLSWGAETNWQWGLTSVEVDPALITSKTLDHLAIGLGIGRLRFEYTGQDSHKGLQHLNQHEAKLKDELWQIVGLSISGGEGNEGGLVYPQEGIATPTLGLQLPERFEASGDLAKIVSYCTNVLGSEISLE
jgi:hypothetical protein